MTSGDFIFEHHEVRAYGVRSFGWMAGGSFSVWAAMYLGVDGAIFWAKWAQAAFVSPGFEDVARGEHPCSSEERGG